VSTAIGAEGISVVSGRDILLAAHPKQFADSVLEVLDNPVLRTLLNIAGRKLVEAHYSWTSIGQRLEEVYQHCNEVEMPSASVR
jgi:glycosyltransferase involved in cell wall biosynthesis